MKSLPLFLAETFKEVRKIHWPTQEEFISSVINTLILVFVFSCFFAIVDSVISYAIRSIIFALT